MRQCISYSYTKGKLFIDFKQAYDLVRRKEVYSILMGFGVPIKLVRLIKLCLIERYTFYSKICGDKYLSDNFYVLNGPRQGDALLPMLFNFALEYVFSKV
jgi:hypothetical protein